MPLNVPNGCKVILPSLADIYNFFGALVKRWFTVSSRLTKVTKQLSDIEDEFHIILNQVSSV